MPKLLQPHMAECHPDRPHRSLGLCQPCYFRDRRRALKALRRLETREERVRRRLEEIAA